MPVVLAGEVEKEDPWGLLLIKSRWIKVLRVHQEIMSQKIREWMKTPSIQVQVHALPQPHK